MQPAKKETLTDLMRGWLLANCPEILVSKPELMRSFGLDSEVVDLATWKRKNGRTHKAKNHRAT